VTAPAAHLRYALRGGVPAIALGEAGFDHPRDARGRGRAHTRYADLTHVTLCERSLWIASRSGVLVLPRRAFAAAGDPRHLVEALRERVAAVPGGPERLARMAALDVLAARPPRPRATFALAILCALVFALEHVGQAYVYTVGYMSPLLVAHGDWWRVVTANLLHGSALHLAVNLAGLLVLGRLLERALGSARTVCVMAASAAGSMLASGLFLNESVVGVSGVVFGLAGGVLWLDLRRPQELPAPWRFPRRLLQLLLVALVLEAALGFLLPFIAGSAHLGGLAAGVLASALLVRERGVGPLPGRLSRALAAGACAVTALAAVAAGVELFSAPDFPARFAERLAALPEVPPDELNNHAWFIAIDESASRAQLLAALQLAERAVAETEGREAALLDTLAEVLFQLGESEHAVETIERAIAQEPDEPYYREQRRRFLGERPADDRPPDPALRPREREGPPLPPDAEGITV
jgi:membrane associated rhomboid family serine protease